MVCDEGERGEKGKRNGRVDGGGGEDRERRKCGCAAGVRSDGGLGATVARQEDAAAAEEGFGVSLRAFTASFFDPERFLPARAFPKTVPFSVAVYGGKVNHLAAFFSWGICSWVKVSDVVAVAQ